MLQNFPGVTDSKEEEMGKFLVWRCAANRAPVFNTDGAPPGRYVGLNGQQEKRSAASQSQNTAHKLIRRSIALDSQEPRGVHGSRRGGAGRMHCGERAVELERGQRPSSC